MAALIFRSVAGSIRIRNFIFSSGIQKKPPFRKIGRDNTFETVEAAGTATFPARLIADLITPLKK
jgi:hypothetical protein